MAIVNSNNFTLLLGTTSGGTRIPIAHAQTATLDISNSVIDVTTKTSNSWREIISGQKSFTVSVDGLVDFENVSGQHNVTTIGDLHINGATVYFNIGIGTKVYTGSGIIGSLSQTGGTDDAPTYSVTIEGTAALGYADDVNVGQFKGDGSTTVFNLPVTAGSTPGATATINGVAVSVTVAGSGSTATFASAPPVGSDVFVYYS